MLDLSPEKMMALLAIGLVVLGPHRLPTAARTLAQGLTKARRLAATLTEPVQVALAEPRQHLERAVADVRGVVHQPGFFTEPERMAPAPARPVVEARPFDPSEN